MAGEKGLRKLSAAPSVKSKWDVLQGLLANAFLK